jgi:pilus assembly protein CpaE
VSTPRSVIVVEPDPYLAVSVEALLSAVHPPPELIAVADLDELRDWARPTGVVVAGPSCGTKQAIAQLTSFRDLYPAVRIVLAFDKRPGAPMKEVVGVGADSLVDPADSEDLRAAVLRAIDLSDRLATSIDQAVLDAAAPMGQVFTVCSATGGCGKTFYSTNIAFALAKLTGKRVALIDLDLQFGEVLTALRVRAQHTITDAIAIRDENELRTYLPEMLTAHESGVWVLPAPLDPAEADTIEPQDIIRIITALQDHFDYIIVDNPTGLGEATLAALDRSSHLFVLASLDLSSVRNLRLFLQTLDRLRIPQDDVSLILNKDQPGVGIEANDIERLFPGGFRSKIPFSREVPRSMNTGMPVVAGAPDSAVATEIVGGIVEFLPTEMQEATRASLADRRPQPWYRKLLSRRADAPAT